MAVHFSAVIDVQERPTSDFYALRSVDLEALGVRASPIALLEDFRVQDIRFSARPRAGIAVVTYVFDDSLGAVRSRTSTGTDLVVGPGGIVWTHCGSGLIHEEGPARRGQDVHGLRMFLNLSAAHKLDEPKVMSVGMDAVPQSERQAGGRVRVLVGTFNGLSSPLVPVEPFTMLDVLLRDPIAYTADAGTTTVVYVLDGTVSVGSGERSETVSNGQALALSGEPAPLTFATVRSSRFLVLTGLQIDEPLAEAGSFLMNEPAQIQAAIARYRSGAMGGISPRSGGS